MNLKFVSESLFGMVTSVEINGWKKDENTRFDDEVALIDQLTHLNSFLMAEDSL